MSSTFSDIDHLLRRAGFGASRATIDSLTPLSWAEAVDRAMSQSAVPGASVGAPTLDPEASYWSKYVAMTRFWLERCRTIEFPLAEKMTLFWHGLLCSSIEKVNDHQLMFDQNQLFRTAGLGNFRHLLHAVSVQPAMLIYLDNEKNRAGKPNENFARELMELFTLGVGSYTETDVRESARAWTGHGLDSNNAYAFRSDLHDHGPKTFFGTTRNWDGPEIIDYLLDGPKRDQVARHVATKLFEFLAYPDPPASVIADLASSFTASNWDITSLVRSILLHPAFGSAEAKQGLLRSPVEFVVAALRHTGLSSADVSPEWQLRAMGQELYRPPNVAGWKQNEAWLTSSALWAKANFASTVRWKAYNQGTFSTIRDRSAGDAARLSLELFGIYDPSAKTLDTIYQRVLAEREAEQYSSWTERAGVLFLPLTAPEFQLA